MTQVVKEVAANHRKILQLIPFPKIFATDESIVGAYSCTPLSMYLYQVFHQKEMHPTLVQTRLIASVPTRHFDLMEIRT